MSAARTVFKLSIQSVRQLQLYTIEVSFEMTGLLYQWTSVAWHRQSSASTMLVGYGVYSVPVSHLIHNNPMERSGDLNISEAIFKSKSQFNYMFTLINVHFSSNSYQFWMQPNIVMKFSQYMDRILICKHCLSIWRKITRILEISNFPRDYFFWRALYSRVELEYSSL